jgi:uncharacterized protein (TIGR02466 family)
MSSVDAAFARAERAAKGGDWPKARKNFKLVLRRQPDNVDALFQLARVYMRDGRPGPALPLLAKASGLAPEAAVLHQTQGTALIMSGDYQAAAEALERCLVLDRNLPGAWNNLGSAYLQLGKTERARAAFEQAVERSPDAVGIRTNLVRCAMQTKDYPEVLVLCRAGLAIRPHDNRLLALEAEALHQLGRAEEAAAIVDFDRFLKTVPVSVPAPYETLEAFNRALARAVSEHPTLAWEPSKKTTTDGRQTEALSGETSAPIVALKTIIESEVDRYQTGLSGQPAHPFVGASPTTWRLNLWGTLLPAGGHQVPHIHSEGWLSGVYYPQVPTPPSPGDGPAAGAIEFGLPEVHNRGERPHELRTIVPHEGLMVLFPSYFYHRTIPFEGDSARISLAFDVVALEPKKRGAATLPLATSRRI